MTKAKATLPTRKARERERHRQEILQAAERVFARKGVHAATVEEIAQEAEFSVGTLYNFFKSKDELHAGLFENLASGFMVELEEKVFSEPDPYRAICALIELQLRHFEEHRAFLRTFFESLMMGEAGSTRTIPKVCMDIHDRYIEQVTAIFARGIELGQFDDVNPLHLTLSLDGIIHAFSSYWLRKEPDEPLAVRTEQLKQAFLSRVVPVDRRDSAICRNA